MTPWIMTYTGKRVYPLSPQPEDIDIRDIAHALSNLCRFSGHCRAFYSVAQHCVLASYWIEAEQALAALLHDASEAYLGDVVRPIKHTPLMAPYREIERHMDTLIGALYGVDLSHPLVAEIDERLLSMELAQLIPPCDHGVRAKPLPLTIVPMSPLEAERAYIARFEMLQG